MADYNAASRKKLYQAVLRLNSIEECERFFEDLCTIREITDMAQRLEAAVLLDRKVSYQSIAKQVGISTATIGRVSKCLNYGAGGYRLALDRMQSEEEANGSEA